MIDLEADWSPILCKLRRCVLQSSIHIFENPNAWTQITTQVAKSARFCLQVIDVCDSLTLTGLRKQNSPDCMFKEDTQEATRHVKQGIFSFDRPLIVIKDQFIENYALKSRLWKARYRFGTSFLREPESHEDKGVSFYKAPFGACIPTCGKGMASPGEKSPGRRVSCYNQQVERGLAMMRKFLH